jgi:catechol 2,3-dioxygenase-like lactoylglutathione lyase family enzyme
MDVTGIQIERLDHLVLTVRSIPATCAFYERTLGMRTVTFGTGRKALHFGQQKINLHEAGREVDPKALAPMPGSGDLCLISATPMEAIVRHLRACSVTLLGEPSTRTGALGPITSVYFRDPDGNLIEVSNYAARA